MAIRRSYRGYVLTPALILPRRRDHGRSPIGVYIGLHQSLSEAIEPLRVAERFTPGNPAIHYDRGTASTHAGKKDVREQFAIHRGLTAQTPPGDASQTPQ
jgi:hypothetical protein